MIICCIPGCFDVEVYGSRSVLEVVKMGIVYICIVVPEEVSRSLGLGWREREKDKRIIREGNPDTQLIHRQEYPVCYPAGGHRSELDGR